MSNQISLEYLAGYFDGEGCVSFYANSGHPPYLRIGIGSADLEVLLKFTEYFGGDVRKEKTPKGNRRQIYYWGCLGTVAQDVLRQLLPFLIAKRPQAELALVPAFGPGKIGKRLTDSERATRVDIATRVKAINQRVTIETCNSPIIPN